MANHRKEIGFVSKRSINQRYGLNLRFVGGLLALGVLKSGPFGSVDEKSLLNLKEGEHYIVCKFCGSFCGSITLRHLAYCSDKTLEEYVAAYPTAPLYSLLTGSRKRKTTEQKVRQSEKLKSRFQTPEGEVTRHQISEAAKKLQASPYGERAAAHLRELTSRPEVREAISQRMKESWAKGGDLRRVVRKWHQTNKQRSLEGAAYARKHIPLEMSGPHKALKAAMNADSELPAFQSEYNVGYFRLDEANPDLKIAVEVDGCYWHGCKECGYLPPKGMVSNDKRKNTYLAKRGWLVVRIPEHQINRDLASSVTLVLNAVRDRVNG